MTIISESDEERFIQESLAFPPHRARVYPHFLPATVPGEPRRIQVSLRAEFDSENSQVAYICRPRWAGGKHVVMDAHHALVDWDGRSFEPTDPDNPLPDEEDLKWYLFDYEVAVRAASQLVWFYADVRCVDCDVDTSVTGEYYSVQDEVWLATGLDTRSGMLCVGCLENRIGRRLEWSDFTEFPINCVKGEEPNGDKSERLRDRMCNDEGWSMADLNLWSKLEPEDKKRWLDILNNR